MCRMYPKLLLHRSFAYVDKWMNSKAGDKATVFTKLLDAKLKVLSDSVSQEPEQTKKKSPKRRFDMER